MFESINPTTEKAICSVYEGTEKANHPRPISSLRNPNSLLQDVDLAVKAARAAFNGEWRATTPAARGKYLMELARLFEENVELMTAVESMDNGKNVRQARGDILAAAGCLRYFGGWADKVHGKVIDTKPGTFNFTKAEPIGVCGQIIP